MLLATALTHRVDVTDRYIDAAAESRAVIAAVDERFAGRTAADGPVVVGPAPTSLPGNIGPNLQYDWVVAWVIGERIPVRTVHDPEALEAADPADRLDLRTVP